ncbi:MAG TPA: DUF4124 domain-containing protein [Burkholderiales bacterium]|nr:DUF4124 domain-containing protein [Burkholderiales bacterium]
MKTLPLLMLALLAAGTAWSQQVYKSVDPQGRVIYTDRPVEGAKPVDLPPVTTVPGVKVPEKKPAAAEAAPAAPRDEAAERRARDNEVRLRDAEAGLEAARKDLAEQEAVRLGDERNNYQKYLDRVQRYRDVVTRQEQEVEALRRAAGK